MSYTKKMQRKICPICRKKYSYNTLKYGHKACKAKGASA